MNINYHLIARGTVQGEGNVLLFPVAECPQISLVLVWLGVLASRLHKLALGLKLSPAFPGSP